MTIGSFIIIIFVIVIMRKRVCTKGSDAMLYTVLVESLYNEHHWDPAGCPVERGVPNLEVGL